MCGAWLGIWVITIGQALGMAWVVYLVHCKKYPLNFDKTLNTVQCTLSENGNYVRHLFQNKKRIFLTVFSLPAQEKPPYKTRQSLST